MKKMLIISTMGVALLASNGAWAAKKKVTVAETTWNVSGEYNVKYTVSCSAGGHSTGKQTIPYTSQKNQQLTIAFNADKTFSLTGDTLSTTELTGDWKASGRKITLTPDDRNSSFIYLQSKIYQDLSKNLNTVSVGGVSAKYKFSPPTYSFTGLLDTTGNTLSIDEKATFKMTASGSVRGFSNTCTVNWSLERTYRGKKAP